MKTIMPPLDTDPDRYIQLADEITLWYPVPRRAVKVRVAGRLEWVERARREGIHNPEGAYNVIRRRVLSGTGDPVEFLNGFCDWVNVATLETLTWLRDDWETEVWYLCDQVPKRATKGFKDLAQGLTASSLASHYYGGPERSVKELNEGRRQRWMTMWGLLDDFVINVTDKE